MPIVPSFSINATPPVNAAAIDLIDTSTGSDAAITSRQVLLYKVDNSSYAAVQVWPYAQSSIEYLLLTQDVALNVVVNWLDVNGLILYTTSQIFAFKNFSEQFYYQLTQAQEANPALTNDANYFDNKMKLRLYLSDALQAINVGADIYSAQSCLLRAIYMVQQHQLFFNV